jgi:protein-S-isoprenylcysteine O-methyltransferase Ste14
VPDLRAFAFKNRGLLLAAPALALAAFGRPTRASAAAGVPLALAGELLRCWAVGYSGVTTRADHVTAPRLATGGPYAHTRNPLYAGNLITALGFTLAFTGGNSGAVRALLFATGIGAMLSVYAAIVPHEEAFLDRTFGDDYADYRARVPRAGWRIKPAAFTGGTWDPGVIAGAEWRTMLLFGLMTAVLAAKAR